ncbi:lipopolysaccharide biosynthesis protein [Parabacteroides distasonis]|nr:lipopolysaccharide biosynthesis protein [Parabacteroides distasonis]
MKNQYLNNKVISATKWSGVTELAAKLVAPITTMALARILTPDAFGVLVTAQMVISFAEVFTDAGFHKYIVQHEFADDVDKYKSTTVAFWSNFAFSLTVWLLIILFSSDIASMVGCPGHGLVISVSSVCIPLTAFSSIQMALYKRKFDFKTLFWVRIVGVLIPLIITIPLALATHSYWALIIGMIALNLSNAILLTIKSEWKPQLYYDIQRFKDMFSFSFWSMVESISIWLTGYMDIFIIGTVLSQHYVGLYRTSMSTVGQITSIITATTTPVLFSSLSRLQNNDEDFKQMFFRFQKIVSILVFPIGMGIFLFRDSITSILLGDQWLETADFIGFWGLTSAVTIVLSHYSSEVYRSKGRPKLSVLSQWLHIIVLWPTVFLTVQYGYDTLCLARSLVRLELIMVNILIMYIVFKYRIIRMFSNVLPSLIASFSMLFILLLPQSNEIWMSLCYILLASLLYFAVLILFPKERNICFNIKTILRRNNE